MAWYVRTIGYVYRLEPGLHCCSRSGKDIILLEMVQESSLFLQPESVLSDRSEIMTPLTSLGDPLDGSDHMLLD